MSEVLTAEQVADWLKLDVKTVQRMAQRGDIPGKKVGYVWRFSSAVLEEWMRSDLSSRPTEEQ